MEPYTTELVLPGRDVNQLTECFTPCDGADFGPAAILGFSVFVLWMHSRVAD